MTAGRKVTRAYGVYVGTMIAGRVVVAYAPDTHVFTVVCARCLAVAERRACEMVSAHRRKPTGCKVCRQTRVRPAEKPIAFVTAYYREHGATMPRVRHICAQRAPARSRVAARVRFTEPPEVCDCRYVDGRLLRECRYHKQEECA